MAPDEIGREGLVLGRQLGQVERLLDALGQPFGPLDDLARSSSAALLAVSLAKPDEEPPIHRVGTAVRLLEVRAVTQAVVSGGGGAAGGGGGIGGGGAAAAAGATVGGRRGGTSSSLLVPARAVALRQRAVAVRGVLELRWDRRVAHQPQRGRLARRRRRGAQPPPAGARRGVALALAPPPAARRRAPP